MSPIFNQNFYSNAILIGGSDLSPWFLDSKVHSITKSKRAPILLECDSDAIVNDDSKDGAKKLDANSDGANDLDAKNEERV